MRLLAVMIAVPLAACSGNATDAASASGTGTNRSFAVADFTNVALAGSDDVSVTIATTFSVRAEGPADVLDRLKIERNGDTLKVSRKSIVGMSWGSGKRAHVFVTMPRLAKASVSGSGDLAVDRAEGADFKASIAGSGNIRIGRIAGQKVTFFIAGSGDISAQGTSTALDMSITGSGDIDAAKLKASSAVASITGSGNITADVTGPATVSIAGSGDADLGPNAVCKTNKLGSGSVNCGK